MKNISDVMATEMAMLENALEGALENILPPVATGFIFKSPMYNEYLTKVEDVLLMYMDEETGEVDGKKAHETLSQMFPSITKWVSVPQTHFKIADEVNKISMDLVGREVL